MKKPSRLLRVFRLAALPLILNAVHAQTISWTGDTDLNWSTADNWSPNTVPTTEHTAYLGDTGVDRTIVYNAGASGALDSLTFSQTSAFLNALDVQKSLTVADTITLAASNGGTTRLSVSPGSANLTLTANGGVDIQSGGELAMNFGPNTSGNSWSPTLAGDVTLSGGTLAIGAMPTNRTTGAAISTIDGDLTLSSGTIFIDNTGTTDVRRDVRLKVTGNFTATGGSLTATTGQLGFGYLMLTGAVNTLSNFSITPSAFNIMLMAEGDQTLTGLPTQTAEFHLRGSGIKTIGSAPGGATNNLMFHSTTGALLTLKLDSDLTASADTQLLQLRYNNTVAGNATALGVDLNGHTLDMTRATASTGGARGGGVWSPNHTGSATGTTWALSSSATDGRIKASGYDFTGSKVTVTVGANVTLEATNARTRANKLGNGPALDVTSTFDYNPVDFVTASTLASGRTIGALRVSNGELDITGPAFEAAGGITVAAGATLDFTTTALTTPTTTLLVNNEASGLIKANNYAFAGDLVIQLDAYTDAAGYGLFALTGATTGHYDTVTISGTALAGVSLNRSGSIWTGTNGTYDFSFSEATGTLGIAVAIPESASTAILTGFLGLGLVLVRRKHRA